MATLLMTGLSFTAVTAQEPAQPASPPTIVCNSQAGAREHCAADTSAGIALVKSTGPGECLLGKTWGYDEKGVWVSDGCAGEFLTGPAAAAAAVMPAAPREKPAERIESWGEFDPGDGFLVGRSSAGELSISGYALLRYVNQTSWRADVHRSPWERARRRRPQRHLSASHHGLLQGLARQPEAGLRDHLLDRLDDRPARDLRQYRLPVQPQVQPLRRPQRQSRHAFAAGIASLLARARPRDGRRVLPAILRIRRSGPRAK